MTASKLLVACASRDATDNPEFINGAATTIPWKHWGPLNTRIFQYYWEFIDATDGNPVLRVDRAIDTTDDDLVEYSLHMMDFSPLAIEHRQGLGRLVREPTTIDLDGELVITSLPYVVVTSSKKSIPKNELVLSSIDSDKGRIYAFHVYARSIKVIKIWEGV
ncbi:hypothetical protein BDR03DRAFT_957423 [Suillus americanus]|nr:hypothetical protein BDR03DRAFT_957423 [Suillus americanus]